MAVRRFPISGDVDLATAPDLQAKLYVLIALTDDDIVLDCAGLNFIDSTGIRLMVTAQDELAAVGRRCVVENISDRCRKSFEVLGLTDRLGIGELDPA